MELKPVYLFLTAFIVITLGIITIQQSASNSEQIDTSQNSDTSNLVYTSPTTLTAEEGITSSSVQTLANGSALSFDGVNDYALVESDVYDSVTFWYKDLTSTDWTFITNSSGTLYVNGEEATPVQYPVYFNTTHYFIGKTNATHFFNGSIDDFRIYNISLTAEEVLGIYSGGRQ